MDQKPVRKVIEVGYFRELTDVPDEQRKSPSILDYIGKEPQENEDRAVAYLRGAPCIAVKCSLAGDVLDPSSRVGLGRSTHTDGSYIWSSTLAYYVEKYHVRLPEDFLRHMASADWCPPSKDQIDEKAIWEALRNDDT
jgi:hypothetical protein